MPIYNNQVLQRTFSFNICILQDHLDNTTETSNVYARLQEEDDGGSNTYERPNVYVSAQFGRLRQGNDSTYVSDVNVKPLTRVS